MLRHLDRSILHVNAKVDGKIEVLGREKIRDLSGGSLSQSLCKVNSIAPFPINSSFTFTTPSAGFESPAKTRLQLDILDMFSGYYADMLWASSGSDAIESAIWAVDVTIKRELGVGLNTFIVRRGGYHGNTFLCREISLRTLGDAPLRKGVVVIDENQDAQKQRTNGYAPFDARQSGSTLLQGLIRALASGEVKSPAVLVLEGYPTTGWRFSYKFSEYQEVFKYCRDNNIITVLDDVASGFYRHGQPSSVMVDEMGNNQSGQSQQLYPDVLVLSKGLTSGAYPLSCCLLNLRVVEAIRASQKKAITFTHGLTESASLLSLNCINKYKEIFLGNAFSERSLYIKNFVASSKQKFLKNGIGIEHTDTSIRLDLSDESGEELSRKLFENNMWAYMAKANLFLDKERLQVRQFMHICPPFDLSVSEQIELLELFKTNLPLI